jgi:sec-independent protein translocase protein TatB
VEIAARCPTLKGVFGNLGWLEIGTLLVVALLVFGPDKLPAVARDAARMLRELRKMAQGARTQLKSELGPEFADFDFDSLNPRAFVRKHLLEDIDEVDDVDPSARWAAGEHPPRPGERPDGQRAPYDPDTT